MVMPWPVGPRGILIPLKIANEVKMRGSICTSQPLTCMMWDNDY